MPLHRLEGRVLGLIGFGNIPRAVVPKAKAFGLTVITADPYVAPEHLAALGVENTGLDDLLARSDFVSVHAPLLPATRGLIGVKAFAAMKKGAVLINTARGPAGGRGCARRRVDSGHLGGAALDVVITEPLAKDSPLLHRDNVIFTRTPRSIRSWPRRAADQVRKRCARVLAAKIRSILSKWGRQNGVR